MQLYDSSSTSDKESLLASIIKSSDDAIEGLTFDGTVMVWNKGSEELYGFKADEIMNKSVLMVYPKNKSEELTGIIEKIKRGEHTEPFITQRITKDGKAIDVAISASPIKDNSAKTIGLSVISRPFAGQERVEKYARQAEEQSALLAAIVQSSDDAIIGLTLDGNISSWNLGAEKMFGFTVKDTVGKKVNIIYPIERSEEFADIVTKIKRGEKIEHFETQRKTKDGVVVDVSERISAIKDEVGEIIGISKIIRDITGQKRAARYARSLIESSLDPLVTISPEGKITDVNEATVEVTGVPREKLIGSDFSIYFTEPGKAREGYQQVFSMEKVTDYPLTIRHVSGKTVDVLYNASVYKDEKGRVLGVFAAARDVTSQRQASQYARSLIEASLDPLVTISVDGKITDVNKATIEVTGVPRESLIGSDFSNYFTDPEEARQGYQQVFKEGFVRDYPLAIRRVDGIVTDVLYNATVYKDVAGKVLGVFAAARDITERKKVEEQAHLTSAYARSLIEASLDPLVTIGPDGKITDVNNATEVITGVSREWLIGTDFSNYFTEPRKAREGYRKVFKEGSVRDYPLAIRNSTGGVIEVLYNASVYKDAVGKVIGIFAAARDVTETKKASQYARSLIESSLDPLVTISPEGKITDVNEATIKVTGVPREKLIGTDFSIYFTEPQKAREGYEEVFKLGFVTDYPLTIRSNVGKLTDVLYNASVYKDGKGQVLGVFAAARDYTRVKETTREVETSNKELEAFSYSVSHDLRAPLRAIDGFSKILIEDYSPKLDADGHRVIETIRDNAQKMGKLIDDILAFSRTGRQEIKSQSIQMDDLVKDVYNELLPSTQGRVIKFNLQQLPPAQGDANLIRLIWVNLLSNAIKFTKKKEIATIEVSGRQEGEGQVVYSVKDNGAGFDMKYANKLFGVFQRLHSGEEFEGTGVGLAIVQRIAERHGGKAWAEGKVDEGATFSFSLSSKKL
jgi:PAS domain S-box-containing protein